MVIKQESKISVTISGATQHFSRIWNRNQIAKKTTGYLTNRDQNWTFRYIP